MIVVSGVGSGNDREVMVVDVVRRLVDIEEIVHPQQPFKDHLTLWTPHALNMGSNKSPSTLPSSTSSRRDENRGWARRTTSSAVDFIPIAHKLEFPKYDGSGYPLPWLNCCECYFYVRRTLEHKHVAYVAFHLDDAQLWFASGMKIEPEDQT
jgi:hypothetical protein